MGSSSKGPRSCVVGTGVPTACGLIIWPKKVNEKRAKRRKKREPKKSPSHRRPQEWTPFSSSNRVARETDPTPPFFFFLFVAYCSLGGLGKDLGVKAEEEPV